MKVNANKVIRIAVKIVLIIYFIKLFYEHAFFSWIPKYKYPAVISKIESNSIAYALISIIGIIICGIIISIVVDLISVCIQVIEWDTLLAESKKCLSLKVIKPVVMCCINICCAVAIGLLLLMAVYQLPLNNISKNVGNSVPILQREGVYPYIFSWCFSKLDNYTDSAILMEAGCEIVDSPVNSALMTYTGSYSSWVSPSDSLKNHFVDNIPYDEYAGYPRYWHGYLVIIKPLLMMVDYGGIRIINGLIQSLLCVSILFMLAKRGLKKYVVPYLISYFMLMPVALFCSFQFSSCYYAMALGTVVLLLLPDRIRKKYSYIVFLNIGIFLAYFDYLTYPLATFGVPCVIYIALNRDYSVEKKIIDIIKNAIAWSMGYALMWISKWVITALLTDYNIIEDAFGEVGMRISGSSLDGELIYTPIVGVILNYLTFVLTPVTLVLIVYISVNVRKIVKINDKSEILRILIPYIIVGISPMAWYIFATNHSMIHYWFTSKSCVVSTLAMLFGMADCISVYNKEFLSGGIDA